MTQLDLLAEIAPSPVWGVVVCTAGSLGWDYLDLLMGTLDPPTAQGGTDAGDDAWYFATARGVWVYPAGEVCPDRQRRPDATWEQIRAEMLARIDPEDLREEWDTYRAEYSRWLPLAQEETDLSLRSDRSQYALGVRMAAGAQQSLMYEASWAAKSHLVALIKEATP